MAVGLAIFLIGVLLVYLSWNDVLFWDAVRSLRRGEVQAKTAAPS